MKGTRKVHRIQGLGGSGKEARQGHARVGATPCYVKRKMWEIGYTPDAVQSEGKGEKAGFRVRQADRRINIPLAG